MESSIYMALKYLGGLRNIMNFVDAYCAIVVALGDVFLEPALKSQEEINSLCKTANSKY